MGNFATAAAPIPSHQTDPKSEYYFANGFFIAKVAFFVLVALAFIYPTMTFLSWSKALKQNKTPDLPEEKVRRIRMLLMIELTGIAAILFCAAFMADGWGISAS